MLIALFLAVASPASGTIATGQDYLRLCRREVLGRGVDGQLLSVTCVSFVNGFVRGAAYVESMKERPAFCLGTAATTQQMMDALEKRLRANALVVAKPFEEVAVAMLADRFPCPAASR